MQFFVSCSSGIWARGNNSCAGDHDSGAYSLGWKFDPSLQSIGLWTWSKQDICVAHYTEFDTRIKLTDTTLKHSGMNPHDA